MMTIVLAGLPIAMVLGLGLAHMMKRRTISMPDYAELPTPSSDSSGETRK